MTDAPASPVLKNLVLFCIALAVLGILVALATDAAFPLAFQHAGPLPPADFPPVNGCWGGKCH